VKNEKVKWEMYADNLYIYKGIIGQLYIVTFELQFFNVFCISLLCKVLIHFRLYVLFLLCMCRDLVLVMK